MNEHQIRQLFVVSVLLKGAHAVLEIVSGAALALISTTAIANLANTLTQDELVEDPNDFIATHLLAWGQGFSVATKDFYALYLLSHGVVKLLLAVGLLGNNVWAYPASLIMFGLFVVYQLYRYSYTGGAGLIVLSVLDIVVIGLYSRT